MIKPNKFYITLVLAASSVAIADEPDPKLEFEQTAPAQFLLDWQGEPGWTYFIQVSTDLQSWMYVPEMTWGANHDPYVFSPVNGTGQLIPKFFTRLRMSDIPVADLEDAKNSDFDNDGVSNMDELQAGTDPFAFVDTDMDSLPDAWEMEQFGDLDEDADGDSDNDGIKNFDELRYHLDANSNDADASGSKLTFSYDGDVFTGLTITTGETLTFTYDENLNILSTAKSQ